MTRRYRWIVGLLSLIVLVTISAAILWSAQSGLMRWLVIRQLGALTNRQATIEQLELDLRHGRLEIAGLRLADRQPGPPFVQLDRLDLRFDPRSLLRGGLTIRELALRGVNVRIVRSERGELNIPDLGAPGKGTFNVTVDRLTLADGHVAIEDHMRSPVQHWRADAIAVEASGLSTRGGPVPGSARLAATVGGAPVSAEITDLRLAPLHLRGTVDAKDVDATVAGMGLPADLMAVVEGARLTVNAALTVDARDGVSLDAEGRLDALAVRNRRTGDPFASVPSLAITVDGLRADASGRVPTLGRIAVTGAATLFHARRAAAGRFAIERLRLAIEQAATSSPSSAHVSLTAGFSGGGSLEAEGPLRLAPFAATLRGRVSDLDATVLLSYVDLPAHLSGTLDTDLAVDLTSSADGIASRIRGRAAVKRAAAADGARELARVRQIEVDGVDVEWPRMAVARVRVVEPVAHVERDREGRVSLAALLGTTRPRSGGSPVANTSKGPSVEIGEIAVVDGTLTLDDRSGTAPVQLALGKLRATAKNVVWPPRRPVAIDVKAATPDAGSLEASGTLSLDPLKVDVRARLAGAALAPYQGYLPFSMRVQGFAHLDLAIAGSFSRAVAITAKGTGALNDLTMSDGDRRIMRVSRIETTGVQYTWPATLSVDRLHVGSSRVRIERRADGTFPLATLFARPPTTAARTEPAHAAPGVPGAPTISVTVRDALLEDGRARFVDSAVSPAANIEVSGVKLVAHGFTWPARGPMPIELRATTPGGGHTRVKGALDLASASLDAKVGLKGVDLAPAHPYLPLRAKLAATAGADLDVKARLDPLSIAARGRAGLSDAALTRGERRLISVARVEATGLDYTWPTTVAIDRLHVQRPQALVERARDGAFPIVTIFTERREPSEGATDSPSTTAMSTATMPPLHVSLKEAVLDDGSATMTDRTTSPAARFDISRARLVVRDFAWPPQGPVSVRTRASLPGQGTVRAHGQLGLMPTSLDLEVTAEGVDVTNARPYLPIRGEIGGKAGASLNVHLSTQPLAITARGTASVAGVRVADRDQSLLTADRVALTALDYTWPATVSVDQLSVEKPWAIIDRVSGQLPVVEALTGPRRPDASPPTPDVRPAGSRRREARRRERVSQSPPTTSNPPLALQLTLRRGVVENGAADIVDGSVDPPVRLQITGVRLALRDFAWPPPRAASRFLLRAAAPSGGRLEARGNLRLDTPAIDTKLVLERADLATLQPLIPIRGRVAGQANADLTVKGPLTPMALSITGTLAVADASFGDAERALVTAKGVDVGGIAAAWPQRKATIQHISIREPWVLVERDADGTLPLLALIAPRPTSAGATPAKIATPRGGTAPPVGRDASASQVEIGALAVEDGFVRFTDRTTTPRFVEEASRLTVTARGLGTAPATRSEISVSARLTGGAQLDLQGTMGPIGGPLFADVQGTLSGLALNQANPYLNKLLGWVAREGSIGATTRFRIHDDRLEAENEIVIGQPRFAPSRRGDEVRQRVGVPLDLLVSLLENSRREVRLSVPVTGNISSRQFDFGETVWEAIRKAAVSVLALPVSWVGKVLYTDDSRIATISIWPVSFEPGTTRMRRGIDKHAERLATFMQRTPSIAFAMKPIMTVEDVDALKREALQKRIDALARGGGTPDAAAARLFAERFPGRPAPADPAAMLAELAKVEPLSDGELRALATARVALVQHELEEKGDVNPTRLRVSDGAVPVEASGQGRVEFEMIPDAPPTQ